MHPGPIFPDAGSAGVLRAIVGGTLTSLGRQLGCTVEAIMSAVVTRVDEFFVRSRKLDALTMEL